MARKRSSKDEYAGMSMREIAGLPDAGSVVKVCGPGGVPLDAPGNPIPQYGSQEDIEQEDGIFMDDGFGSTEDHDFSMSGLEDRSLDDSPYMRRRSGTAVETEFEYGDDDLRPENGSMEYDGSGYDDSEYDGSVYDDSEYDDSVYGDSVYDDLTGDDIDVIYEQLAGNGGNPVRTIVDFAERNGYAALGEMFYDCVMDGGIDLTPDLRKHLNFIYSLTKLGVKPAEYYRQ